MLDGLKFNHIGLAVRDIDKAKKFLEFNGYSLLNEAIDPNQNIRASLMQHKTLFDMEIISKINQSDITPIDKLIQHNSSAIYHICYECNEIDKLRNEMKENNLFFKEIVKKMYSPLFKKEVSFYITDSIGMVEIIHN